MPFALITLGLITLIVGAKGTYGQFGSQLRGDLFGTGGQKGFIYWILAILAIGALGYIEKLRPLSHIFLVLLLVVILLANKGVAQNLLDAVQQGPAPVTANPVPGSPSLLPTPQQAGQAVGQAATGQNPGSDLIGQWTTQFRNWLGIGPQSSISPEQAAEIATFVG